MKLILGLAAALTVASTAQAAPPPAEAFGRALQVQQAAISPNGQKVAILGGAPNSRQIAIATIDQSDLPVLTLGDIETLSLRWVNDDYVLARIAFLDKPKLQPRLRYRMERNVAITAQAKAVSRLLDNDEASQYITEQPVLGVTRGAAPRAFVLGLAFAGIDGNADTKLARKGADADRPFVTALMSVDPKTGNGKLVERGDYDTVYWSLDAAGFPRVRMSIGDLSHIFRIDIRRPGARPWVNVVENADEGAMDAYLGYAPAEDALYLREWRDGGQQIVRVKLADSTRTEVWRGDATGTAQLLWDADRAVVTGVSSGGDDAKVEWIDKDIGAVQSSLVRALKASSVSLRNWSDDRNRFVLRAIRNDGPASWYLYDRQRKELSPLGDEYPELAGAALGQTRFMTYKAADGLDIPAYVTMPPGAKPGAKLPLVVLPHGGPAANDEQGFDWLVQFIATRGYVVLQPQYRGSTGFGAALENAGAGEWGGKMHSDLRDGVARLAADGVIDPAQVCIVGASFGGYLALSGVTLDKGIYRCAASIAGVSNLGLLAGDASRHYGADAASVRYLKRMWTGMTPAALAQASPISQAGQASAPILLIHGDNDTTVPPQHSTDMQAALAKAGKSVELVMLTNEDHYLMKSDTRTQALKSLEAFLARNLPVTPTP